MLVTPGEKVHVIYRAFYDGSLRRHFVGTVLAAEGALCRVEGYTFVTDTQTHMFERKPGPRTTMVDLAHPGYIANVIHPDTVIDEVAYHYVRDVGLVCTDGKAFSLNINEYGART